MRFNGGDLFLEFLELTAFATEFFFDGGVGFEVSNLRQVGKANTWSELDVAGVLLLLADGVEQRGLSSPVVANDADSIAVVDFEVDVAQHIHGAKGAIHGFDVDEFSNHVPSSVLRADVPS